MATPQELLDNLKNGSKELELKEESIVKKIEENKNAIDEFYNNKINELNNFNPPFTDENGNAITFDSNNVTGDKYEYLKMYYAEYDANNPVINNNSAQGGNKKITKTREFESSLKKEIQKIESKKVSLKIMAESMLKYKIALVDKNNEIIENLKNERDSSKEKKENLQKEIDSLDNQITETEKEHSDINNEVFDLHNELDILNHKLEDINDELNDLITKISDKKDELNDAKNNNKPQDEIDRIQKELDDLNTDYSFKVSRKNELANVKIPDVEAKYKEKDQKSQETFDKCEDLKNKKNEKQNEMNLIPDISTYDSIINEMQQINERIDKSLEKNLEEFTEKFEEIGVDFDEPVVDEEIVSSEKTSGDNKAEEKNSSKQEKNAPASGSGNNVIAESENNSIVPLSEGDRARFRVNNFLNSSFDEQKKLLDYYGYAELAEAASRIGPFQRRNLTNILESHLEKSIPNENDFKNIVDKVSSSLGIDSSELYHALVDQNNKPVAFNKVDLENLKKINTIISNFNQNKGNYSENEIKEFEQNFMQFIKKGALLQRAKTGRIANIFSGLTKKSAEFRSVINSISSYTNRNAEIYENKESLRQSLRGQVNREPQSRDAITLDSKIRSSQDRQI